MFADIEAATSLDERLAALWRNFADPPAAARDWVQFEHEVWVWANRPGQRRRRAPASAAGYRSECATLAVALDEWADEGLIAPLAVVDGGRHDARRHAARARDGLPARSRRHQRGVGDRRAARAPPRPGGGPVRRTPSIRPPSWAGRARGGPPGAPVWLAHRSPPYPILDPWGTPDATRRDRPARGRVGAGRPARGVRPAAARGAGPLAPRARRPRASGRSPATPTS